MHAIKKLDAFTMNLSLNLEPVYSIILAIILFNENEAVGVSFYIGTGIILLTVMWHAYTKTSAAINKKLEEEKYNYD
jgi:drug/metabolite transporter (DMT)-like permease